jgi:hypothetical protein
MCTIYIVIEAKLPPKTNIIHIYTLCFIFKIVSCTCCIKGGEEFNYKVLKHPYATEREEQAMPLIKLTYLSTEPYTIVDVPPQLAQGFHESSQPSP